MRGGQARTSLKSRRRKEDPMREFDRLPPELRGWLASAILPWRPRSVLNAFARARATAPDIQHALEELDRIEMRLIARDAARIWGEHHPFAAKVTEP
ncbi:MAG: DUF6525 family protein [Pseudomonadota bacterium]